VRSTIRSLRDFGLEPAKTAGKDRRRRPIVSLARVLPPLDSGHQTIQLGRHSFPVDSKFGSRS
jgi:hypothetical protein